MKWFISFIAILGIVGAIWLPQFLENKRIRLGQDLIKAARHDDLKKVKNLLAAGADVNAKSIHSDHIISISDTALHQAANNGYKELVEVLITAGADVNAKTDDDVTPLLCAVMGGYKDTVELLIEKGADVNEKDSYDGQTLLQKTVMSGTKEVVESLIAMGANINVKDKAGKTALDLATTEEIKQLLIKHGAKYSND